MKTPKAPTGPDDLSNDYIVFVPTSTPEKVAFYQHAADTAGWPIQFRKMQDLVEAFHIIDEVEGDYEQNASDKLREAGKIIHDFNNGKSQQLVDLCEKKWGIRFQKDHILFATDDSGMDGPPGVWEKADHSGVPRETLEKIEHYVTAPSSHGEGLPRGGAGTELVPVVSAMLGQTEYVKRMAKVIADDPTLNPDITGKDLRFVEHSTLIVRKLNSDHHEDPISFVTPLLFQVPPVPDTDIKTSWHYLRLRPEHLKADRPQDAGKTAFEMGQDYLGHYSPRRQIVDHLAMKVLGLTEKDKRPRKNLTPPDQPFHVACVDFDPTGLSENAFGKSYHFSQSQGAKESAAEALGEVEKLMKSADAFVLKADHGLEEIDRFRKFYTLFSMTVAKLLNGRDMNKPIIIQNHVQEGKGCWDDAIAMHNHLVKKGMTKDFVFPPKRDGLAGDSKTELTSNGYFDAIRSTDMQAIDERAQSLLDWHKAHYEKRNPVNGEPHSKPAEGEKAPEDMYKVAVFLSASSENDDMNRDTKDFCKELALKGYGMVTGGGDRHSMGAAYEGYHAGQLEIAASRKNTRTWSGAFSTQILLDSETRQGKFADGFDYKKCCADIYERMAGMLESSDTVVVRAGGAGTAQEWLAFLILKEQFPEKMAGKNIIIYNPTVFKKDDKAFYDPLLEAILGKEYSAIMGHEGADKQKTVSMKTGIYVADNDEKIMDLVDQFAYAKDSNQWKVTSASREVHEQVKEAQRPGFTEQYYAKQARKSPFLGLD